MKKLSILLLILLSSFFLGFLSLNGDNTMNNDIVNPKTISEEDEVKNIILDPENVPKISASLSNFQWWNGSWTNRISVNVSTTVNQYHVPVEILINFSAYFEEFSEEYELEDLELDEDSIRVIEYQSASSFTETPLTSQFDPWDSYDNHTNAIGDVIWIIDEILTTTKQYFIYFNTNESSYDAPDPNYPVLRVWHEGFEEIDSNDILSAGSQDSNPSFYELDTTVSQRGNKSLHIWGNCWKTESIGFSIDNDDDTYITAKMRFDDPGVNREETGIAIHNSGGQPTDGRERYNIRGNQGSPAMTSWGVSPYDYQVNDYYAADTFFWYSFHPVDDISPSYKPNFNYFVYMADDDALNQLDLYWDDISIWNQEARTIPDDIPVISIGTIEPISFGLSVVCLDIDGFRVEGAQVSISNYSQPVLDQDATSNDDGIAVFTNVSRDGFYNISITYSQDGLETPETKEVYSINDYQMTKFDNVLVARLTLWRITFNITDRDGNYIENGHVDLINNSVVVGRSNIISGKCNITWINQTSYDYEIYYDFSKLNDGSSYKQSSLLIDTSSVIRTDANKPTYKTLVKPVNTDNAEIEEVGIDNLKVVMELKPASGGIISEFNLTIQDVRDYIISVDIDGSDADGILYESIHSKSNINEWNYTYLFNYTKNPSSRFHPSDLSLEFYKFDRSENNGTVKLTYVESTHLNIPTKISRVIFNFTDTVDAALENAILSIYNETDDPGNNIPVANLTVDDEGIAIFIGLNNETAEWGKYTITLYAAGTDRTFKPYLLPVSYAPTYNFTFETEIRLNFTGNLNIDNFLTGIVHLNPEDFTVDIYWRDEITVKFNFTTLDKTIPLNKSDDPTNINLQILDDDFVPITGLIDLRSYDWSIGNFSYTFNSSKLGLIGGRNHYIKIIATKAGYVDSDLVVNFDLKAFPTQLISYEYDTKIQATSFSEYYNELINISLLFIDNNSEELKGASLYYEWINLDPIPIYSDPMNDSLYYFTIDTSIAGSTGLKNIRVIAFLQNYSEIDDHFIDLEILERVTTLNNNTGFYYFAQSVWVKDAANFTFEYRDGLSGNKDLVYDLNVYEYTWQKTDSAGNPIGGEYGVDTLRQRGDHKYDLDFDTETRAVGYYLLIITMHKANFQLRNAIINLRINIRIIDTDLDAKGLDDDIITVVHGKKVDFKVTLLDTTRGNIPLQGASVEIEIGSKTYDMDEDSPGVYKYTFDTDDVDAFFTSKTLSVTITINQLDFDEEEIEVTLVVTMEEIFDGMPMFYFIMIVSAISAVVGSLVGYRFIQQAKIPKFVKKIRAVKKSIKSRSSIPSISFPTKNELILKEFNKEWSEIDLSLSDTLKIDAKKTTLISKAKDMIKQKGGDT